MTDPFPPGTRVQLAVNRAHLPTEACRRRLARGIVIRPTQAEIERTTVTIRGAASLVRYDSTGLTFWEWNEELMHEVDLSDPVRVERWLAAD